MADLLGNSQRFINMYLLLFIKVKKLTKEVWAVAKTIYISNPGVNCIILWSTKDTDVLQELDSVNIPDSINHLN